MELGKHRTGCPGNMEFDNGDKRSKLGKIDWVMAGFKYQEEDFGLSCEHGQNMLEREHMGCGAVLLEGPSDSE